MAQFDVFRNPGGRRDGIPFVVTLQNKRFEGGATRFVAPLVRHGIAAVEEHYLTPRFIVEGTDVVLDLFNLATVPRARLGAPIGSLADEQSRAKLTRALDEFLSQA
jgi:toxin CcdB